MGHFHSWFEVKIDQFSSLEVLILQGSISKISLIRIVHSFIRSIQMVNGRTLKFGKIGNESKEEKLRIRYYSQI